MAPPRIALLGFSIECNRFAQVATEADFRARALLSDDGMLQEGRTAAGAPGLAIPILSRSAAIG